MQFNKDSKIIILLVLLAFMAVESVRSQENANNKIAGYYISLCAVSMILLNIPDMTTRRVSIV